MLKKILKISIVFLFSATVFFIGAGYGSNKKHDELFKTLVTLCDKEKTVLTYRHPDGRIDKWDCVLRGKI